jgi:MOSC domain-containing protein YiiM
MGVGEPQLERIELVSVNVGVPRPIGVHAGRVVISAIGKTPVTAVDELELTTSRLEGDRQADLRVHGDPDKALFAYGAQTLEAWAEEYGQPFPPGFIGENLTVAGVDEDSVHIGDTWRWGGATVQVCQPRAPCYKLGVQTGQPDILRRFEALGRTGWYLRVLVPGRVPVAGPITLVEPDPARLSVRMAHLARAGSLDRDRLLALAAHPALGQGWRSALGKRLEAIDAAAAASGTA